MDSSPGNRNEIACNMEGSKISRSQKISTLNIHRFEMYKDGRCIAHLGYITDML